MTESITITLQETPRSVITALALGGITVPRTGQTPIITPPTGGGAQWTASNITWEKNEPPNETADTQFSASTIYRARFTITPNPDYTLDGVLNDFTLTGAPTGTIVSREGETGNITIVFPVTGSSAADYITNLIIGGVVAPIRGVAPNATAPTGGGDQWTASISWYNINNPTPVEAGTHFSSAAKYRAVITINPSTNWANPPTATVFTITDITGVTGVTITRESGIITIDFPAMGGRCVSANCTGGCNDDACQGVGTDNTVITNNQTPRIGVWDVEAWDQQTKNGAPVAGEIRMVVNPAGHFSASWNDTYNTLFRSGRRFGEAGPPPNWTNLSRTHAQIGTISLSYNVSKYEVEGASYLGAYGWFTETLIEWYVIDNWNDWRPGQGVTWTTVGQQHTNSEGIMTTYRGTIPVDGGNYHVLETTRTGPTIMGGADQQFTQIYSVRTVPRDELNEDYTISISTHINEWTERVSALLETSLLYEAAFVVEGYNGNNESNGHVVLNVLAMTIIPPTQPIEEFARFTLTNADSGAHIALGAIVPNQIESISFDFRNATGRNQVAVQGIPGHGNIGFPSAAAGEWVTITILQTGFMGAINTAATHIQVAPNGRAINDVFDIKNVVIVANGTTHNLPLSSIVTPGWGINRVVMSDAPEPDCPNCDNNPCTCPPPEGMDTLTSPVQTTTAVPSGRHVIFDSTRAEDNAATHLSIEGTNRGPFAAGNTVFFTNFGTHDTQNNPMGGIIRLTSFGGLVPGDVVQIAGRIGPNTAPALNPHDRGSFSVFGNQIFTDNNAVPTFRAEVTLTAGHISGATPLLINFNLWNFNVSPAVAFENIIIAVDQLVIHGVRMNETQATVALNAVYDAINTELGAIKAALDNPINYNMTAAMFTNRINAAVAAVTNPHRNLVSVTTAVSGGFDDVNPADFTGTITVSVVGATLPGQEPTPSTRIITLTGFNLPDAPECEAILLAAFYAVSGFFRGEDEFIKFAATNNATQALVMPRVNNVLARFPGVTAGTPTWAITPATATNNGLITISIPLSINPVIAGDVITRTFEAQLIIQRHHLVYSMEGDAMFQALATGATPSDFGWGNSSSVLRQAGHGTSGQLEVRTASGVNYLLVRQDNPNRGGSGYRMDIRTSGMVLGTANDNRMFEVRVTGRVQGTAPADMEMVMNIDGTNARVVASQQIIGSNTPFILAYEFTVEDLQNASRFGIYTLNGNGVNYTIESVTVMQIVGTPPVAPPPAVPPVFTIPPNFFPVDESAAAAASPPTEQQLEDIGLELPDDGVDVEFTYVPSLGRVGLEISVNHEDPNLEIPGILLITDDLDSGESVEYYYVKVEGYAETGTRISIVCADTQFEYGFVIAESPFTLAAFIPQNIITNNLAIIVSPMVGAIIESITSFVLFDVNITPTIATVLPPLPPQGPLAPDTPAGHFVPSAPPVPRADVLYRMSDYWGDAEELEDFGILYTSGSPTITLNQRLRRIEITERANHHDGIVINPYLGDGIHLQPGDIVRVEGRMPRASRGDGRFTMNMNMGGLTPRGDVSGISDAFPARRWTMEYTLQASDFDDMRGIVIQTYTWGAWPPFLYDFMVYDVIITRPHPTRPVERWNLQDILNRQTTRVGTSAAELGMFHSENSRARVVENDGVRSIYVTTGTSAWFTLEFCLTSETNIGVGDTVRVTGRNGNPPTATGTFGQMQINAQPGGWTPVAATHMANNLNAEGFWSLEFVVTETALNLMRNPLHGRRPGFAFQASANASFYLYDITVISSQATGRRPEQMSLEEIGCICEHCWPAGGPAPATPPPLTLEVGVVVDIGSDNIATFTADALYDEIINLIETGPMEPLMLNLFVLAPDDGITEVTAVIPGTAFAMINDADVNFVMQIQTPIATMRIPQTVLNAVKGDEIKIVFKEIEGTGRPVYEFVIIVDGEPLTDFSGGAVTIIIPYTLTRNENPHAIFVNFINPVTGELELVRGSFSGAAVTFAATHFSQFIINHNPVRFADIPQDFRAEVMFVGATGLMVGVGGNRFDPEAYVTREMMLVTLMRAAGIPQATDTTDNFIDAGGNRWYTGYVAQAKQLGITSGVGNDRFGIGNIVTNAEALILMYNTLEAIGMLPENAGGRTLEDFGDTDQLPRWVTDRMREGISLMTEAGIFAEQELNPTESMKRQMLARLLFNLMS
ncbi:MAG: glycoside hydrolase family 11 protein [Defluviitaleaceae bacterium]|nr:glycoside hydrolase family 11 protein [Defluviitaleaceae bacterium]